MWRAERTPHRSNKQTGKSKEKQLLQNMRTENEITTDNDFFFTIRNPLNEF